MPDSGIPLKGNAATFLDNDARISWADDTDTFIVCVVKVELNLDDSEVLSLSEPKRVDNLLRPFKLLLDSDSFFLCEWGEDFFLLGERDSDEDLLFLCAREREGALLTYILVGKAEVITTEGIGDFDFVFLRPREREDGLLGCLDSDGLLLCKPEPDAGVLDLFDSTSGGSFLVYGGFEISEDCVAGDVLPREGDFDSFDFDFLSLRDFLALCERLLGLVDRVD